MRPFSSMSIDSAAGFFGNPGIVMIDPVTATRNPAPADSLTSRTVTVNPDGLPSSDGSSESEYCVFAIHTSRSSFPNSWICARSFSACSVYVTPDAP